MIWLTDYRKLWEARFDRLAAYLKQLQAEARKQNDDKGDHL